MTALMRWLNENSGAVIAAASVLGVVVAGVYALFTWRLWQETRRQANITYALWTAAERQANITQSIFEAGEAWTRQGRRMT